MLVVVGVVQSKGGKRKVRNQGAKEEETRPALYKLSLSPSGPEASSLARIAQHALRIR